MRPDMPPPARAIPAQSVPGIGAHDAIGLVFAL
jgi:hypothetical protein